MEERVRLRVELSRLLESAAEAHAKGDDPQADELVEEAMRLSEKVATLEQLDMAPRSQNSCDADAQRKGPAEAGPQRG
jgi:hypothetical protein